MHDGAEVHHVGAIRDLQRAVHVLLHQQHRDAFALEPRDRLHHVLHDLGRQALAGLVEQHQARRAEQRARDGHHLHLAAGKVLALAVHQVFHAR